MSLLFIMVCFASMLTSCGNAEATAENTTETATPVKEEKKDSSRIENSNGNFGLKIKGKINLDNVGKKKEKATNQ